MRADDLLPEKTLPTAYVITSLSIGGAQKVLLALLKSGLHQGSRPLLISLLRVPGLEEQFRTLGVEVFHLDLQHPFQALARLFRLRKLLQQRRIRLIYSMLHHANLLSVLLRVLVYPRPALLWGMHDTPEKNLYTRWSHRLILWLTCRLSWVPEQIVLVSGRSRERYKALGYPEAHLQLIPNGVSTPEQDELQRQTDRAAVRQELSLPADSLLLGSLTRAVPEKDLPGLLTAFAILSRLRPDVHLLLAGEGVDKANPELASLIAQLDLSARVHLLGMRHDVPRLINALDIATLPSRSEAFPLFVAEAMAAGIPCVATDVGDIALLLGRENRYGRLVKHGDSDLLVAAWNELLEMSPAARQQLGHEGRLWVAEHFSEQAMIERHRVLFASLSCSK